MNRRKDTQKNSFFRAMFWLLSLILVMATCQYTEAATQTLYLIRNTGTTLSTVGPVTTNATDNYTYNQPTVMTSLMSKTSNNSNTYARLTGSVNGTWYTHSRFYYYRNPAFGSAAAISAGVTGRFYLRSSSTTDKFRFKLLDFDPATGVASTISTTGPSSDYFSPSTTTGTAVDVNFGNSAYSLPQGHYLGVEIQYQPNAGTTRRGYVYYNGSSYPSRINVETRFTITSSAGANGSITGPATTPGDAVVDLDSTPSYTVTANSGYNIQSLTVNGALVPAAQGVSTYTLDSTTFPVGTYPGLFSGVTKSFSINANFVIVASNLTISPGDGGSIAYPAASMTWAGGTTHTYTIYGSGTLAFTATPDANYGIEEVYINGVGQGVPQGQTTPYSFNATFPGTNSIAASFLRYYSITTSAGTGGTIDPPGPTPTLNGQSITLSIIPDNGYRILSVTDTVNGVTTNVGNSSTYTITNVAADHLVTATFQRVYTITATAGANGTISPIGDVVVDSGANRNFSITPNFGYRVSDILVDNVSVGASNSYTFTNVNADHTISVAFVDAPVASTYCAVPSFISTPVPPNVMLMLSVETPMMGAANPTVTCTGTPSALNYTCSSSGLGAYDNNRNYYGYFETNKCYTYSGSGATGLFSPSGAATNHQCAAGTAWSGNMLNWATMLAVDAFRKAFTGGNRVVDTDSTTVLLGATNTGSYFSSHPTVSNAELYMPVSGTNVTRRIMREGTGSGFVLCPDGNSCDKGRTGSGESQWPTTSTVGATAYSLRIKVCDATGGSESRCNSTTNKPEGTIQKYMDKMRFALMSFTSDGSANRDGGVLREKMKWVSPKVPNGLKYHDASNTVITCSTNIGCDNPEKEVNTDGTFVTNPDGASSGNSGVINYINKFAYTSGYKNLDPAGEMYYEVVRYFKNLTPSYTRYCEGITEPNDGFAVYCNSSKTHARGWRDPTLYSCSQNFVIAINDANPWLDKRIPGSAFKANYGGNAANDYCGSGAGACDTDFLDGGVQIDVEGWTNKVGDLEGLTGTTLNVACEVDASGACIGGYSSGKNVVISKLGRIIGTPPYPAKDNSYNMSGLAYYAHSVDLRPDLPSTGKKRNLTTYMIDTQEPGGNMLVGPKNMLQLAAKYGGFEDKDNDQSVTIGSTKYNRPFSSNTCGGVSATPNVLCSEWDADNDGYPDNYFFASDASKVETGLYKAFASILNRATSGTAAAVANNRSGERGANIIQALFYPQWPSDMSIKWLGDVQALWFYLDPIGKFSGIFEDSDSDKELNLAVDLSPGSDATTLKALWKAGEGLLSRAASDRAIYTLLSSTDITNSANAFTTTNRASLKPLLDLASVTDTVADEYINYIRGVDGGTKRSRTVTNNGVTGVWKLADVINSKPQIQGAEPVSKWFDDYFDSTYQQFTKSTNYLANNYVYAGSNGGMLHAFKLGQVRRVNDPTNVYRIAEIVDETDIGKELWAFIPTNALPYLKNCADSSYCHQYMVDGTPRLIDASINNWCGASNYWTCERKTTYVTNTTTLNTAATSWKSVLVSSMGLGGATRDGNCNETLNPDTDPVNNLDCIKTPVANGGFSSYFALDVTSPLSPQYMWEFSDVSIENDSSLNATEKLATKGLGLTTSGSAIVRINSLSGSPLAPDKTTNGRWFAVFGSGPTGTIDTATHQFLGRSDQNLKIYVVDLNASGSFTKCKSAGQTNCNYWVFDTGIKYAFAGPLTNATIDIEKRAADSSSFYSDDVVYIPYTKATTVDPPNPAPAGLYPTAWDKGGIVRLVTNSDPDPMNWFVSPLIDDVGPITSSVDLLLNKTTKKLWIFFGEGRYFYTGDDLSSQRRIFGIADPCYNYDVNHINMLSTTLATCPAVTIASLKDQTSSPLASLGSTDKGWYINLAAASGTSGAERMKLSAVSASFNGVVFFPTFAPSTDLCIAGGDPSLWAVNYSSGGTPPSRAMQGKVVGTTSDQPVAKAQSLQSLFGNSSTSSGGRKADLGDYKGDYNMTPPILSPKPVKRIMSIQER